MIGISPERLEFELARGETATQKVFIENLNPEPVQITIEASQHSRLVFIKPEQFVLPPATLQDISVEIRGTKDFTTELNILARENVSGQLQVQSGVKVPVEVTTSGGLDYLGLVGLSLAVVISVAAIKNRLQM